jgi:hypothetical protein
MRPPPLVVQKLEATAEYPLWKVEEEVQVEKGENKDTYFAGVQYRGSSQAEYKVSFQYRQWECYGLRQGEKEEEEEGGGSSKE